jgi:hypothetical protein
MNEQYVIAIAHGMELDMRPGFATLQNRVREPGLWNAAWELPFGRPRCPLPDKTPER